MGTLKQEMSTKKTCYAQSAQVKNIRKKMVDIIQREVGTTDLKEVVNKLIPDSIARDIEKACQGIYPLHDVHIRHRPQHRRGSGEARGLRAPSAGSCLDGDSFHNYKNSLGGSAPTVKRQLCINVSFVVVVVVVV